MSEPMNDREFVEWCRAEDANEYFIDGEDWLRLEMLSDISTIYPRIMIAFASLRLDLAERDKQVAELSVSGGELIERWHTAIDQRDEARRQVAELTAKNAALEIENAALDEGGASMTRERDAYSKASGDYAMEIGRLEEKLAERDKAIDGLQTIRLHIQRETR